MKDRVRWRQMTGCPDPCSDGLKEEVDCALDAADGATWRISVSAGVLANTRAEKLHFGNVSKEKQKRPKKKDVKWSGEVTIEIVFPEWRALSSASGSSARLPCSFKSLQCLPHSSEENTHCNCSKDLIKHT